MRKLHLICIGLLLCGLLTGVARAETFTLSEGKTVTGELIPGSANDAGIQIRVEEGKYERVPWGDFSQEDLKKFAQEPKLAPLVAPFIEVSQEERVKKTEVKINQPQRLARPADQSLIGAMFSSSIGLFLLFAMYAANIYAAYEIAVFRAQPKVMVCGLAAILPVIGPVIFLCLPTRIEKISDEDALAAETVAAAQAQSFSVPGQAASADPRAQTGGLHVAHGENAQGNPALPPTQTFQRGAFTFNRRFFETKFPGFFGVVRRDAEKDMVLVVKAARGTYAAQRITRISANELHLDVHKGHASEEVMVPFSEIQELQLKHKDA